MKKFILFTLLSIFMLSCADDSWKQELEEIKAELANQKALIEALQKNSTITSIEQGEGKYTIHFSDGQSITLSNGKTPVITIGENENWFINGVDTGKPSKGEDGQDGENGTDGETPTIEIGENGNWFINGTDTGIKAEGIDGNDAPTIISIINDANELVFIFSDNSQISVPLSTKQYPHYGKKLFCVGDSYTLLGKYFKLLIETTKLNKIGDTGSKGNGQVLTNYSKFILEDAEIIKDADFITILGGVNDYLHGGERIGTFDDEPGTYSVYGAIKQIIKTTMEINPRATVVFFSQPECGKYGNQPIDTTPPAENMNGLTMANIAEAMEDCCKKLGVPCCNTHSTLWNFYQLDIYTYDKLHPNQLGADKLGKQMGEFINGL